NAADRAYLGGVRVWPAAAPEDIVLELFGAGLHAGGMYHVRPGACFQDTAGSTPAAVGDPVGCLVDLSGNGNHLVQATSTARPVLRLDGAGKHYLEFDGVDDELSAGSALTLTLPAYLASAVDCIARSSSDVFLSFGTGTFNTFAIGCGSTTRGRALLNRVGTGQKSVSTLADTLTVGKHVIAALGVPGA